MNEAQEALVKILASALDELSLGKRRGRSRYKKLGEYSRKHFAKINAAIVAARHLQVLPASIPKFSNEEVFALGQTMRAYGALNMSEQIRDVFICALRERGFPEEILSAISSAATAIASVHNQET